MSESVVVTGGGSGIGKAVVQRLAASGYRIAACGRSQAALDETLDGVTGDGHTTHSGDLAVVADVEDVADGIRESHHTLVGLVLCAGGRVSRPDSTLNGLRTELQAAFDSHVLTTALIAEALVQDMCDNRGRVIAVGSIVAFRGGSGSYATAKAALHGWAFTLASNLGERGITVNVVAPGYIADTGFFGGPLPPERHDKLISGNLNRRAGQPEDVASLIEYLVSADSGHITAQVIQVNGGALPR